MKGKKSHVRWGFLDKQFSCCSVWNAKILKQAKSGIQSKQIKVKTKIYLVKMYNEMPF